MASSGQRLPRAGAGPGSILALFEKCSQSEKGCSGLLDYKADLIRHLTFRQQIFDAFADKKSDSESPDSQLADRYRVLLKEFRHASTDERLRILAQWARAELDILPEDSIGIEGVNRLTKVETERVNKIPFNDLRYACIIQAWLPYVERLFHDAKSANVKPELVKKTLKALGYDSKALQIFANEVWRSPVAFTCAWLATRGAISMPKPRKEPDIAQTLRNAYSRIFGKGAPHVY